MVFMKSKYILPKKITENSDFADLNLAVALIREEIVHAIILHY